MGLRSGSSDGTECGAVPAPYHRLSLHADRLRPILPLFLFLAFTVSCRSGAGSGEREEAAQLSDKLDSLRQRESSLLAELEVARDFAPYLVIDMWERSVQLKTRGRTLRSFRVLEGAGPACAGGPGRVWTMTDRRPLREIERVRIAPGAGEEAAAEAALKTPWGPSRMPPDFDLVCDEGNVVRVRSLPEPGKGARLLNSLVSTFRHLREDYRRWRTPRSEQPPCSAQLWLPEDQARLLFWSLPKTVRIVIMGDAATPAPH